MALLFTFSLMERLGVRGEKVQRVGKNNQNIKSYFVLSANNVLGTGEFFMSSDLHFPTSLGEGTV